MRFNTKMAAAAVLALSIPAATLAQGFDGPYAGIQGGWDLAAVRNPTTSSDAFNLDDERQSFTGGVFAGVDREVATGVVVGFETGIGVGSDDGLSAPTLVGSVSINPQWSLDLSGRAGYLLDPTTLAYVRGGYTTTRVETTAISAAGRLSDEESRDGWLAGAGIERRITANTSARLEYRYADLSDGNRSYDRHRVLAGISYRF